MDAFVLVEREDDLAVAARLEVVSSGILFTDLAVVVDFPVDGQSAISVDESPLRTACVLGTVSNGITNRDDF